MSRNRGLNLTATEISRSRVKRACARDSRREGINRLTVHSISEQFERSTKVWGCCRRGINSVVVNGISNRARRPTHAIFSKSFTDTEVTRIEERQSIPLMIVATLSRTAPARVPRVYRGRNGRGGTRERPRAFAICACDAARRGAMRRGMSRSIAMRRRGYVARAPLSSREVGSGLTTLPAVYRIAPPR